MNLHVSSRSVFEQCTVNVAHGSEANSEKRSVRTAPMSGIKRRCACDDWPVRAR
jgi:hypothetical protein